MHSSQTSDSEGENLVREWVDKHPKEVIRAESKDRLESLEKELQHKHKTLLEIYKNYNPNDKN